MARILYRLLITNAAITVAAFAAVVVVSGGWQAIAAAIALMAGFGSLIVFIALGVLADSGKVETPRRSRAATTRAPAETEQTGDDVAPTPAHAARRRRQGVASGAVH
ncbi:MAG TPA: hypothetical protein VH817_01155 [Thermoleophilaceae bacterium]